MAKNAPIKIKLNTSLLEGEAWNRAIRRAQKKAGSFGVKKLKAVTPVDTGLLQSKWVVRGDDLGLAIENPVRYAGFVDSGTSRMAPRNMTKKSIPPLMDFYEEEILRQIDRL
jgi:hypothetical protein